jgi:tetratricopeptide (TPR) repeat protein
MVVAASLTLSVSCSKDSPSDEPSARAETPLASSVSALKQPRAGLDAIARYEAQPDREAVSLSRGAFWLSASKSFLSAAEQPNAPVRWRAGAHFCSGQVSLHLGESEAAAAAFRQAIELDERWPPPHVGLARALTNQGDVEGAIAAARTAERHAPTWFRPALAKADAHARAGRPKRALEERRRALTFHPTNPYLLAEVAVGCQASGREDEAKSLAAKAVAQEPDVVVARVLLASQALEVNDAETAMGHATHAIGVDPENAAAHLAQADALLLNSDPKAAKDAYMRAMALALKQKVDMSKGRWGEVRKALDGGRFPPRRGPEPPAPPPRSRRDNLCMNPGCPFPEERGPEWP